ncbi:hypothetical protein [Streptomyces sp. NPDC007264]|uniref:hypothetical protein n=1 Tax=Streptomyces sp. NPDC007264 TaxID=3364777 RepID=UPI0036DC3AA6
MHRLLPPSAIAGVSVVCAVGPWLFTEPLLLRALATGAAVTTVVGAVVMRRWDATAGKRVADLTRARASDEWRHEERVAELETDLEESRELRTKLEQKLRAKRSELAKLRNEHAALLRRYATAETERASALEGRRLLAIETTAPAPALPTSGSAAQDAPDSAGDEAAGADVRDGAGDPEDADAPAGRDHDAEPENGTGSEAEAESGSSDPQAFSPAGSALFMRANSALERLTGEEADAAEETEPAAEETEPAAEAETEAQDGAAAVTASAEEDGTARAGAASDGGDTDEASAAADGQGAPDAEDAPPAVDGAAPTGSARGGARRMSTARAKTSSRKGGRRNGGGTRRASAGPDVAEAGAAESGSDEEGGPDGQPPAAGGQELSTAGVQEPSAAGVQEHAAVGGQEHAAAATVRQPQPAATKPAHTTGHFTVPTAVAVVPPAPRRRPTVEGGFDFFGTQKPRETDPSAQSVQNEDLADVVGQETLAVHKAESESAFKPVDPQARAVGQVIDLTAHDETEQIDIEGLRTAAS